MQNDNHIYDIAIIGAGPAGIASAVESVVFGIKNIVIFEKSDNHSATIRNYYKDNKRVDKNWKGAHVELDGNVYFMDGTKESTVEYFGDLINTHAIEARFNTGIDYIVKEDSLFKIVTERGYEYFARYVIVAIGVMGKPNKPAYPIPKSLVSVVNFNANNASKGEKIIVVGGGDSAAEYAYLLTEAGNDVMLSYRQPTFSRVNEINLDIVESYTRDGLMRLKLGVDIDYIEDDEGKVSVRFFNGENETFDRMVLAIGGASPIDFLRKCKIEIGEDETPKCDEYLESSLSGLFIAGDVIAKKGGSIAVGLNHAFKIINRIKEKIEKDKK